MVTRPTGAYLYCSEQFLKIGTGRPTGGLLGLPGPTRTVVSSFWKIGTGRPTGG